MSYSLVGVVKLEPLAADELLGELVLILFLRLLNADRHVAEESVGDQLRVILQVGPLEGLPLAVVVVDCAWGALEQVCLQCAALDPLLFCVLRAHFVHLRRQVCWCLSCCICPVRLAQ